MEGLDGQSFGILWNELSFHHRGDIDRRSYDFPVLIDLSGELRGRDRRIQKQLQGNGLIKRHAGWDVVSNAGLDRLSQNLVDLLQLFLDRRRGTAFLG